MIMSKESMGRLMSEVRGNPDLQLQFLNPEVMKDALSFANHANELGYDVVPEDVVDLVINGGITEFVDLSDDDLELIAGGTGIQNNKVMGALWNSL